MLFLERTVENGYTYTVEDVFGIIVMESTVKLNGDTLDAVVSLLLKREPMAAKVEGTVKHQHGTLSYTFDRAPMWTDDDEPCEDIPTSTRKPASASIAISHWMLQSWNWCKRFVVAFREAWKKTSE